MKPHLCTRYFVFVFVLILGLFDPKLSACESDFDIWQIRSKDADPIYRFLKGDKAGYIDQRGHVLIKPSISYYGNSGDEFHNGLLLKGAGGGDYLDISGRVVLSTGCERNWEFSEGLAAALKDDGDKWGYIDRTGRFVIQPQFEGYPRGYVHSFSDGYALIELGSRYGYIDRTGKFVIRLKLLKGYDFHEGFAKVVVDGPCVRFDFEQPCDSAETLGGETKDQKPPACKYAFIDRSGSVISTARFDGAHDFSEGLAAVQIGDKWGFIDQKGKTVIAPQFDRVKEFSSGIAPVQEGELWGYIDTSGRVVISFKFADAGSFVNGHAPVGQWNEEKAEWTNYYYIDRTGKRAFPGTYDKASDYFKGLAHVRFLRPGKDNDDFYLNGRFAYINDRGKIVFSYERRSSDDDD